MNILQAMKDHQVKNLIYSSSCTVYGNASEIPVNEETEWQEAESPYGRTKQIGEYMIQDCISEIGGQSILLRYFNPAGAHPSGKLGESPIVQALNLAPAITETAIGKRAVLTVFGNDYPTRDGSCIRDYIHVMDLARAHTLGVERLIEGKQKKPLDVFNLGIGEGVSVLEAIKAFEKVSGLKLNYVVGARRPGDVIAIYADASKANDLLKWVPQYSIDDIMLTAWQWEKNKS
jgi:UDP-glucose 4-epimerase